MAVYIVNFVLIFLYWMICREIKLTKREKETLLTFFMVLIGLQMILIMGLRGLSVGIDYRGYEKRFNRYGSMSIEEIFNDTLQEHGYSLLIKFVKIHTNSFTVFTFVVSIFSIIPILYTIKKCSKNPFLSILLFIAFDYYAFMFSGMRQGIAYSLCFFSYLFIKNKKLIRFLIVVLLAAQFHKSAYLFLPAYLIAQLKASNKSIGVMITLFAIVFMFKEQIYDFIEGGLYDTVHGVYERTQTNPFGIIILILAITSLGIFFKENAIKKDKSFNCCLLILCGGAILLPFISLGSNAKRIVEYYCVFLILVIPGILDGIEDEKIYKIANVATIFATIVLFVRYLIVDGYNIVPYIMA